jgi:hypothetical protein
MFANPLSVVLAGTLSYPMLDTALILLGTLALAVATRETITPPPLALVAGLVWGLAALVRPVAMAVPPRAAVSFPSAHRPASRFGPLPWGAQVRASRAFPGVPSGRRKVCPSTLE